MISPKQCTVRIEERLPVIAWNVAEVTQHNFQHTKTQGPRYRDVLQRFFVKRASVINSPKEDSRLVLFRPHKPDQGIRRFLGRKNLINAEPADCIRGARLN